MNRRVGTAPGGSGGDRKYNPANKRPTTSSRPVIKDGLSFRAEWKTNSHSDFPYQSQNGAGSNPTNTPLSYPQWDYYHQPSVSAVGSATSHFNNFPDYHWTSGNNGRMESSRPSTSESLYGSRPQTSQFMFGDSAKPIRTWEHTGLGNVLKSRKNDPSLIGNGVRFTLMSYNVLAPGLLEKHPELYGACDASCLDWNSRIASLFDEVEQHDPEIICLQEVEAAQYTLTFEPRMDQMGYRGVFKKKTRDKDDGCAIFYKSSRFLLLDRLDIEFLQPHVPLLNRDNVALLVKLETRNVLKRQKLIVGTTHLLFNPKRVDVRLAQSQLLLAELDRFSFCGFDKDGNNLYHPILMTGDFNCKPISSVIKLFTEQQLQYLDENGELIKLLSRNGFTSLLPPQCGITDNCQHYKIAWERYRRWRSSRNHNFEVDLKTQNELVNLFPFLESRTAEFTSSEMCLNQPSEEIISLLSPVTEGVEPIPSYMETADSKLLARAAQKIALQVKKSPNNASQSLSATEIYRSGSSTTHVKVPHELDGKVVADMSRCGLACKFGSGKLSHEMIFRDIYGPKLDRTVDGPPVSTKQQGWVCVDYIFQSMTYNPQLKKVIEGKLKFIRRLGLFSRNQCKQIGDIPNSEYPSDHFPLVAEFLLR